MWRNPSGGSVRGDSRGPSMMESDFAVTEWSTPEPNHRLASAGRLSCVGSNPCPRRCTSTQPLMT